MLSSGGSWGRDLLARAGNERDWAELSALAQKAQAIGVRCGQALGDLRIIMTQPFPPISRFSHPCKETEQVKMSPINKGFLLGAATLILTASSASAAIVCNEDGDCWRVQGEPRYEPSLKLRIMPDSWRWKEGERYRWREPGRGRGYWRGDKWIEIELDR